MSATDPTFPTFIDTNIWLYAFNNGQDVQKTARAQQIIRQTPQIVISSQIVNEICNNMLRKFGVSEEDIRKLVRSLYRRYLVVELNRDIILQASIVRKSYNISYWDGLVISSAVSANARQLYSEDMQDRLVINNQLTIINPFTGRTTP